MDNYIEDIKQKILDSAEKIQNTLNNVYNIAKKFSK